jgi:hypothetical protein
MKYKLIREIKVRVIDFVEAEDKKSAADNLKSLIAEISDSGLMDNHTCVMYDNYTETIE